MRGHAWVLGMMIGLSSAAAALPACFSKASAGPDAEVEFDSGFEPGSDDGGSDSSLGAPDSALDSTADSASLADAVPQAEAGMDATLAEGGADTGTPDASPEAGAETGPEAGPGPEAGVTNFALSFDDTLQPQYVRIPDAAQLDVVGSFTMEAWVDVTGPGHSGTATVLGKPYGSGQVDTATVWFSAGAFYAAVNLGGTSGAASYAWPFGNGTWHHVAWTFDATSQVETLFVDGASVAQQTSTAGMPLYDGHPLLVGADIDTNAFTFGFYGMIDEVRIFSAVRTAGQIGDDLALVSPLGDPTLVAYYPFDEGTGPLAHDASPDHFDGTLGAAGDAGGAGAAPTWVTAQLPTASPPVDAGPADEVDAGLAPALEFAPTECVTVADNAAIDVTTALSYEAWIDPLSSLSGISSVIGKPVGSVATDSVALWFQSGTLYASVNGSNTSGALAYAWSFPAGTWHHVAFTYASPGSATLYVDGTSVATAASAAGAPTYDGNPFLIGADIDYGTYQYGFLGLIRDVRLFAAARTPAQIASDMSGASPVGDGTLIAYYPLDEGSGTVAHDLSGNHLDGQLGGLDGGVASPAWVSAPAPF